MSTKCWQPILRYFVWKNVHWCFWDATRILQTRAVHNLQKGTYSKYGSFRWLMKSTLCNLSLFTEKKTKRFTTFFELVSELHIEPSTSHPSIQFANTKCGLRWFQYKCFSCFLLSLFTETLFVCYFRQTSFILRLYFIYWTKSPGLHSSFKEIISVLFTISCLLIKEP